MYKFFKNKKIIITGNTGFKGSWLTKVLDNFGAKIYGISDNYLTNPNLNSLLKLDFWIGNVDWECPWINSISKTMSIKNFFIEMNLQKIKNNKESYLNNCFGFVCSQF